MIDIYQPSLNNNKGYLLSLGESLNWVFTSDVALSGWLNRMASIIGIRPCEDNHYPKVIFTRMGIAGNLNRSVYGQQNAFSSRLVYDYNTLRISYYSSADDVTVEVDNEEGGDIEIVNMWNALFPVYHKVVEHNGLPLHSGLAELDGRGILLVGAGDSGKSTCCQRLPGYWKTLCDDEALVVWDASRGYQAHPFPTWSEYLWGQTSGKTWDVGYSVPITAVFLLEQSTHDEVIPISNRAESAINMNRSAGQVYQRFWRRLEREQRWSMTRRIFDNACAMSRTVPTYILRASLTGRFWEMIEEACF